MWVKFEVIPSKRDEILLPASFRGRFGQAAAVQLGGCGPFRAEVAYTDEEGNDDESSYDYPLRFGISKGLSERLFMPQSPVYRVMIADSHIYIGPVIGLLLGVHTHLYNPYHMQKYSDRFGVYDKIGGLIFAFSPNSVNWEKHTAFGLYFNIATEEWEYGCFPMPEVIYRRDFHSDPTCIRKLIKYTGGKLFNSYRFTKMDLYNYLKSDEGSRTFLPPTELSLSFEQVARFIDRYGKVILKPIDLSRGRGICIVEKSGDRYRISDYRYRSPVDSVLNGRKALESFFNLNRGFFKKYLIQRYLDLAKVGDAPFDIRVVMQKHKGGVWGCTGIECRVGGDNSCITNISRGGYALTLAEALRLSFVRGYKDIPAKIDDLCKKFCLKMDRMGQHFAEFGIDVAVDTDKSIWLIEANVFPSFKGFKAIDPETYLSIRYTPLLYALSLTRFADEDKTD